MEMLAEAVEARRESPAGFDSGPPSTVLSLLDGLRGLGAIQIMDVYHFTAYVWARGDDKAIFVYFDDYGDDRVAAKIQIGLADTPSGELDGLGFFDLHQSKIPWPHYGRLLVTAQVIRQLVGPLDKYDFVV